MHRSSIISQAAKRAMPCDIRTPSESMATGCLKCMVKVNRRFAFGGLDGMQMPDRILPLHDPSPAILTSRAGRRESEQFHHFST